MVRSAQLPKRFTIVFNKNTATSFVYTIVVLGQPAGLSKEACLYADADRGGDVAQLVEHRTGTPLIQVRFPGVARDFSPRVNFHCRFSYVCPYTPLCNRLHLHLYTR